MKTPDIRHWIIERDYATWDNQIAQDLASGRLDDLIVDAEANRKSGRGHAR